MMRGKWLWGTPNQCLPLGDVTFRHRGQITFQVERHGGMWWCHRGFSPPTTLSDRAFDRRMGWEPERFHSALSVQREDGWGSFTKKGCVRKVCRAIDAKLARNDAADRAYLEAKGVRA